MGLGFRRFNWIPAGFSDFSIDLWYTEEYTSYTNTLYFRFPWAPPQPTGSGAAQLLV